MSRMGGFALIRSAVSRHWPLWSALLLLFWMYGPFVSGNFLGFHDTKLHSLNFIAFYRSSWSGGGGIAQWLPYGGFGIPALNNQCLITPWEYLVAVFGLLFRISSPLLLWNLSVLTALSLFVVGLYLCSCLLCKGALIRLLVVTQGATMVVWQYAYEFSFLIYAGLPLSLYALLKYHQSKRIGWVSAAFALTVVSVIGSPVYTAPVALAFLGILLLPFLLLTGKPEKPAAVDWFLAGGLTAFALGLLGIYFSSSLFGARELEFLLPGRDPVTKLVNLQTYLSYGGNITEQNYHVLFGGLLRWHALSYISPVVVAAFVFSLWSANKSRILFVLVVYAILVLGFTRGGFIALLLYKWFPAMHYFRHLGLMHGFAVPALILAGGHALDLVLNAREKVQISRFTVFSTIGSLLLLVGMVDIFFPRMGRFLLGAGDFPGEHFAIVQMLKTCALLALLLVIKNCAAGFSTTTRWIIQTALLVATLHFAIQLRGRELKEFEKGFPDPVAIRSLSDPLPFVMRRSLEPAPAISYVAPFAGTGGYSESLYNTQIMNAIGVDSLYPPGMYHFISKHTNRFFLAERVVKNQAYADQLSLVPSPWVTDQLGFTSDVVRWSAGQTEGGLIKAHARGLDTFVIEFPASEHSRRMTFSTAYSNGWNAIADGRKLDVRESDTFGLLVDIPAGVSRLLFAYRDPLNLALSWLLMMLALAGAVGTVSFCVFQLFGDGPGGERTLLTEPATGHEVPGRAQ